MSPLDVQIRLLPPMSVVTSQGTGPNPEEDAWRKLAAWAEPAGLLAAHAAHAVFGFNNPPPEAGKPTYGYEFWIKVDPSLPDVPGLGRSEYPGRRLTRLNSSCTCP